MPYDLTELDRLAKLATPGPWRNKDTTKWAYPGAYIETEAGQVVANLTCTIGKYEREVENASFIAALVNAWPEIRRDLEREGK